MTSSHLISAETLARRLPGGGIQLFDCRFDLADPARGARDYRDGHLPGAAHVDLERDLSARPSGTNGRHPLPDRAAFAATLRRLGLRHDRLAVAYDGANGMFAARLWWMLRWIGHEAAVVLDGGIAAWRALGLPIEQGDAPPAPPGDIVPGADPGLTVTAEAIVAALGSPAMLVIDARAADRFRGAANPLDPVAGHIPGARNRPFAENVTAEGRFKPPAELAAGFAAVLGGHDPRDVVLQCGSGVSACHNALAMAVAGLPAARLYPGSWSEWIADPARPVATGPG